MSRSLLLALLPLSLCACSTTPPAAPVRIDPPPVGLMTACPHPGPLNDLATVNDLAEWSVEWVRTAACERSKRAALLMAWPR